MVLALLNNGIDYIAKHSRYLALGLDIHRKLRPFHHLTVPHLHGSYLQDVIFKHVQSCSLGIEHHYRIIGIAIDKSHEIRRLVVAQQVGGQYGTVEQIAHKLTCSRIALIHTHTLHQSRPRHKAELIVQHAQMSQQQLHVGLRKQVGTRNLEVSYTTTSQFLTYILCVAIGVNHKGRRRLRERAVQRISKLHTVAHLLSIIFAT